jgi:ribosomal-protein-alanine N-acetyltransferase
VIVRSATRDDVDGLQALEERLFGVDAWSSGSVAEEVGNGHVLVAEDDGQVVGYVATRAAGDAVDLTRVGVVPDRRRGGLATRLLDAALSAVPTAQPVLLEVSAGNAGALAFYVAAGFVEIDRRRRYYRDGTDAVVMRRTAQ